MTMPFALVVLGVLAILLIVRTTRRIMFKSLYLALLGVAWVAKTIFRATPSWLTRLTGLIKAAATTSSGWIVRTCVVVGWLLLGATILAFLVLSTTATGFVIGAYALVTGNAALLAIVAFLLGTAAYIFFRLSNRWGKTWGVGIGIVLYAIMILALVAPGFIHSHPQWLVFILLTWPLVDMARRKAKTSSWVGKLVAGLITVGFVLCVSFVIFNALSTRSGDIYNAMPGIVQSGLRWVGAQRDQKATETVRESLPAETNAKLTIGEVVEEATLYNSDQHEMLKLFKGTLVASTIPQPQAVLFGAEPVVAVMVSNGNGDFIQSITGWVAARKLHFQSPIIIPPTPQVTPATDKTEKKEETTVIATTVSVGNSELDALKKQVEKLQRRVAEKRQVVRIQDDQSPPPDPLAARQTERFALTPVYAQQAPSQAMPAVYVQPVYNQLPPQRYEASLSPVYAQQYAPPQAMPYTYSQQMYDGQYGYGAIEATAWRNFFLLGEEGALKTTGHTKGVQIYFRGCYVGEADQLDGVFNQKAAALAGQAVKITAVKKNQAFSRTVRFPSQAEARLVGMKHLTFGVRDEFFAGPGSSSFDDLAAAKLADECERAMR